jgi:CubicO group peptidase (beta-lactamase class C family)
LLDQGRADGVFPMAAAWIGLDGEHLATAFTGRASASTQWDLASLTKPMVVVTAAMRAVAEGHLDLDAEVTEFGGRAVSVADLLAHRSGYPPWCDFRAAKERGEDVEDTLSTARRDGAAVPTTAYSDLGYIHLGRWLAARSGRPLVDHLPPEVHYPAHARVAPTADYAPTGWEDVRGRHLQGEVHDTNTWALGGIAGHAGAFAPIDAVGRWASDLARAASGRSATIDGDVVRLFWDLQHRDVDSAATWVLGWDTPSPAASTAGRGASASAVGHLGFTGTSVWIDRDQGLTMVLLSNRVAMPVPYEASADRLRRFRAVFHDGVRDLTSRS